MFFQKSLFSSSLLVLIFGLSIFRVVNSIPVTVSNIGPGVFHAGVIGNYAGHLSGGKALAELQPNSIYHHDSKDEEQSHDFSEHAAENNPSLYESLGSYGEHLQEHDFPADYGAEDHNGAEYAEVEAKADAEAESAASEHHEDFEEHHAELHDEHDYHELKADENEIDIGAHFHDHGDDDDFHSKPVPGIDHGKGAFSYSTTYEFKDPKV